MGLISPGGENLLDFLELRQVLSIYFGNLRDPLWWPQEAQSPCELLGGLSGFLSPRSRGLRPCVERYRNLRIPLQCEMDLGVRLESPQGSQSSSRVGHASSISSLDGAAVSYFPSSGSRNQWLSLEAFPQGFRTRFSHRAVPRANVV